MKGDKQEVIKFVFLCENGGEKQHELDRLI